MIISMERGNEIIADMGTDSPESHYGIAVYVLRGTVSKGDTLSIIDDDDEEQYTPNEALVYWTDGIWAIAHIDNWSEPTRAIHLATGYQGTITLDGVAYAYLDEDEVASALRGEMGKVGVSGAITDFTGATLALVF